MSELDPVPQTENHSRCQVEQVIVPEPGKAGDHAETDDCRRDDMEHPAPAQIHDIADRLHEHVRHGHECEQSRLELIHFLSFNAGFQSLAIITDYNQMSSIKIRLKVTILWAKTSLGHKYFSSEKSRDPGSRRRAPSCKSSPAHKNKRENISSCFL